MPGHGQRLRAHDSLLMGEPSASSLWTQYHPLLALSDPPNWPFMHEVARECQAYLEASLKTQSLQAEAPKVAYLVFSLWDDLAKRPPRFLVVTLAFPRIGEPPAGLVYINPFHKIPRNGKDDYEYLAAKASNWEGVLKDAEPYVPVFAEYVKWLEALNKERDRLRARRVDFWDFVHERKWFLWPICICRLRERQANQAYVRVCLPGGGEHVQLFLPARDAALKEEDPRFHAHGGWTEQEGDAPPASLDLFGLLASQYLKTMETALGRGVQLYEFPVIKTIRPGTGGSAPLITSLATLSVGATSPLDIDAWNGLVNGLSPFYSALIQMSSSARVTESTRRHVRAAIMSRNLSHNIGSHVLADAELLAGVVQGGAQQKAELSQFHQYMQSRMDFIAKAIGGRDEPGEPAFFRNEIVGGFMRQSLLLQHLVKDTGVGAEAIEVVVTVAPSEGGYQRFSWTWSDEAGRFAERSQNGREGVADAPAPASDPLVGVPGGRVGCHAFYAILENIMRNACKYGTRQRDCPRADGAELVVALQLDDRGEYYELTVSDGLSVRNGHTGVAATCECCVCKVRRSLRAALDQAAGTLEEAPSHGMFEIAECARLLAGNTTDGLYPADLGEGEIRLNGQTPVNVFGWEMNTGGSGPQLLAYRFRLQKPRLLGLLGFGPADHDEVTSAARSSGVHFFGGLRDALRHPCQILLVNDHTEGPGTAAGNAAEPAGDEVPEVPASTAARLCGADSPDAFARQHTALPYRTIVWTCRKQEWEDALKRHGLHPKRFRFAEDTDLCALRQALEASGSVDWPNAVVEAYELWLGLFKGRPPIPEGKWRLVIGLERKRKQVSAWAAVSQPGQALLRSVDVTVHCSDGAWTTRIGGKGKDCPRSTVVFLNKHAQVSQLPKLRKLCAKQLATYHEFSMSSSPSLAPTLEHPPEDTFGLRYFLLGLVEAALTNVYTVDERVADSTHQHTPRVFPTERLGRFNRARVFPLYTVRVSQPPPGGTTTQQRLWVSPTVGSVAEGNPGRLPFDEGLELAADGVQEPTATVRPMLASGVPPDAIDADVLVVHEGIADRLHHEGMWQEAWTRALFGVAPGVVRTSGRGSEARHLETCISFVEFSEISWASYQSMNKYLLVKTLLGSVGGEEKNGH